MWVVVILLLGVSLAAAQDDTNVVIDAENIDQLQEPLSNIPYEEIRELFLKPKVANVTSNDIKFEAVDYDKLVEFLCTEKNFSSDRVNSALQKVQNSDKNKNQSLEKWF